MNKKRDLTQEEYNDLMEFIISSLMKNGIKATTMDSISAARQMSKRTLYEIFESKEKMLQEAHEYFHKNMITDLRNIFNNSDNIMEAIIKCFLYNRDMMSRVSVAFVRDINETSSRSAQLEDGNNRNHYQILYDVLRQGVKEGFFYDDTNLMIQCRMLGIQMESLKRMEELFPEDFTPVEIYDNITLSFLRGICNDKGRKELDRVVSILKMNPKTEI